MQPVLRLPGTDHDNYTSSFSHQSPDQSIPLATCSLTAQARHPRLHCPLWEGSGPTQLVHFCTISTWHTGALTEPVLGGREKEEAWLLLLLVPYLGNSVCGS